MAEGWAKIKPAAKHAGVSERTVRGWLKSGLLHSRLPTGTILIKLSNLDRFLEQYEINGNEVDQIADEIFKELT